MTAITGSSAPTGTAVVASGMHGSKPVAEDKTTLGKDAFLGLLVTQLRYQDPSSPMDSGQMMAQTAQMSTVEQLTELTTTSRESFALQMRLSASSLIGREVSWTEGEGEAAVTRTGTVDAASFAAAVPTVKVGDAEIALDALSSVRPAGTPASTPKAAAASGTSADQPTA